MKSSFDPAWRDWAEAVDPPKPKVPWWANLMAQYQPMIQANWYAQGLQACTTEQMAWLQTHQIRYGSWLNGALGLLGGGLGI